MSDNPESPLHVIVLAAGRGKRMASERPKVLLPVGGRPMLAHVLDTASALNPDTIHVVYGHGGNELREAFRALPLTWVEQAERLGTGHAVMQALPDIPDRARVLVLCGDTPLVPAAELRELLAARGALALLTMRPADPAGYGRVVRDRDGAVARVVEDKDATADERALTEVNTGLLAADAGALRGWLDTVDNDNRQGEYYLTDVIARAARDARGVSAWCVADAGRMAGANDRWQLSGLERRFQALEAKALCEAGVSVMDPARLDVRGTVNAGRDVTIDVNVVLEGDVTLEDGVAVGPHCVLRDTHVGARTRVLGHCDIAGTRIGADCRIGPFARLRPGTDTGDGVVIGNFVETKNARIAAGAKANHLSYVGDARVGANTNLGAGTITCNYDGANKHVTTLGDDVFIGSHTALVAPVTVGDGATIGAGSTITTDAPAGRLTVSRARQVTLKRWRRPIKRDKD